MDKPVPLLFDTDIGTDIDDAVALAYLLQQPRCELLGVTTVTGEPRRRAALADAVCQAAGRHDVPIHPGAARPLLSADLQPRCEQADVLQQFAHRRPESFTPGSAVPFLRQVVRSRPGEVTLLAVGPLTNVALLLAADPEIAGLLRRVVWMGGAYGVNAQDPQRRIEHNASCDPEAAAMVFASDVPEVHAFGLDVTLQCRLVNSEARSAFERAGRGLRVVAAALDIWARRAPQTVFHDPLAAAAIFAPELVALRPGRVEIERQDGPFRGQTCLSEGAGPHQVAVSVDAGGFLKHYFATVT